MAKQPYIYTLPEQFIEDKAVPTHWRLWALINGFFISGKSFYATNEWIEKQLGVKQWAISTAFTKLEEMGLIVCKRSKNSREVLPAGAVRVEGSGETLPPQWPTTISHSDLPLHNSDSISENKNAAKAAPSFSVVSDSPRALKTPARDKAALALQADLYAMFEKEYGSESTKTSADYFRVLAALKRLEPKKVKWLVEERLESGRPPRTLREALTDRSIDMYLQDNA